MTTALGTYALQVAAVKTHFFSAHHPSSCKDVPIAHMAASDPIWRPSSWSLGSKLGPEGSTLEILILKIPLKDCPFRLFPFSCVIVDILLVQKPKELDAWQAKRKAKLLLTAFSLFFLECSQILNKL